MKKQLPLGSTFPFKAEKGFPTAFKYVWGYEARCSICSAKIRAGELIRWREASKPRTLVHVLCELTQLGFPATLSDLPEGYVKHLQSVSKQKNREREQLV